MANTTSAKKAARKATRRTAINKARSSAIKTTIRKVEEALQAGDKAGAAAALKTAEPILARGGQKGVIARKAASRKVSRLNARLKKLA